MNCLKCGREIPEHQVFCEDCLQKMQKYPVPPDTVVRLPRQSTAAVRKAPKKRSVPLEEQVKSLHKSVRIMAIALIISSLLIAFLIPTAVTHFMEENYAVGQNYNTIESDESEDASDSLQP